MSAGRPPELARGQPFRMQTAPTLAIVTRSERMRALLSRVDTIARSDTSVLLVGETGVGKELFADYIHRASARFDRPFVKLSLSAMPHELLESELFGHERGAFTSAVAEKRGLFDLAHTGTLFLDDIDDVPPGVQVKLLRVLESRQVMRVGGSTPSAIDVRLVTASKVDLKDLVARNLFRADLFYRINVCPVEVPPLRQRREDVPLLAEYFLRRFASGRTLTISPDAERALVRYDWPGNVRELRNIMQRLALFAEGEIRLDDLPPEINPGADVAQLAKACTRCLVDGAMSYTEVVACLERNLLRQALADAGSRTQAARLLGLSLSTLRDKLKKHGLDDPAG
jgi:transcriptional regulator with GAF, ATPase, and Fis domain